MNVYQVMIKSTGLSKAQEVEGSSPRVAIHRAMDQELELNKAGRVEVTCILLARKTTLKEYRESLARARAALRKEQAVNGTDGKGGIKWLTIQKT